MRHKCPVCSHVEALCRVMGSIITIDIAQVSIRLDPKALLKSNIYYLICTKKSNQNVSYKIPITHIAMMLILNISSCIVLLTYTLQSIACVQCLGRGEGEVLLLGGDVIIEGFKKPPELIY